MGSSLVERVSYIAKKEGITIFEMERVIGASKGTLYKAVQGGTDIQAKWLTKIVENYPSYSAKWLLTGELPIKEQKNNNIHNNVRGKNNVVSNGNISNVRVSESGEMGQNTISQAFMEQLLLSKEEQLQELTEALKEAQHTIRALISR